MLDRKVFDDGIEELIVAFPGFEMVEAKADLWYKYSKYLTDKQWIRKISECIINCNYTPTLADVLNRKEDSDYFRA